MKLSTLFTTTLISLVARTAFGDSYEYVGQGLCKGYDDRVYKACMGPVSDFDECVAQYEAMTMLNDVPGFTFNAQASYCAILFQQEDWSCPFGWSKYAPVGLPSYTAVGSSTENDHPGNKCYKNLNYKPCNGNCPADTFCDCSPVDYRNYCVCVPNRGGTRFLDGSDDVGSGLRGSQ